MIFLYVAALKQSNRSDEDFIHIGHQELVFTDLYDIVPAEAIEGEISAILCPVFTTFLDCADVIHLPLENIGMVTFNSSDFYHFCDITMNIDTPWVSSLDMSL